jgi:hypothetical protein
VKQTKQNILLLCAAALVAACVEDHLPPELDEEELVTPNGLLWADLSANWVDTRTLMGSRLTQHPATQRMADTPAGQSVLGYLAAGALPPFQRVTIRDSSGQPHDFFGGAALHPGWMSQAPSKKQTECLVGWLGAHLNAFGVQVNLSLRGDACGYPVGLPDAAYGFEEAAFAGDNELHIDACVGEGLRAACGATAVPTLEDRVCASGDPRCGQQVTVWGDCNQICSGRSASGGYFGCKAPNGRLLEGMTTVRLAGGLPYPCSI